MYESWWRYVLLFPIRAMGIALMFVSEHADSINLFCWQVFNFIKELGTVIEAMLQVLGRIAISFLLAVSLFVLCYRIMVVLDFPQPALAPYFELVMRVFDGNVVWVVPLIFGATLGVLHIWKLQLDQRRYWEERRERLDREAAKRAQRHAANMTAPLYQPSWRRSRED